MQFNLGRDIDAAAQDVQSAINAAGSTLPRNLPYPPTYAKVNPADAAVVTLALTSDIVSMRDLSDLADTLIAQRLSTVTGVGHVSVEGGIRPAVRIQADVARLASYGLSISDLNSAITSANVAGPKGSLDGTQQSYTIAANDQIASAEAYREIVVAFRNSAPVRLKDVATVEEGLENARVGGWYQGTPAVIIDVQRQPGANVIETVDRLKAELPRLERALPKSAKLTLVHDRTDTIRASIHDVQFTLVLSVVLVVMVVLVFLRSGRATIIAGVALPVSLIATFAVMYFCGFSLDNLSLMALTIGTGFVVDDAIVMIENIVRHIEKGAKPLRAALDGASEIGFTVISLTMSLIAVFIPLLFMTGLVGRMFREFALTLTIAVVVSAIVSLTLTPMMAAKLLKHQPQTRGNFLSRGFNWGMDATVEGYRRSLEWVLRHQPATLMVTALTLVITIWMYVVIPKGFLPSQDTGLVTAVLEAEPQVSFAELSRLQATVTEAVRKDPAVEGVVSVVGVGQLNPTPNVSHLKITLKPRAERGVLIAEVVDRLERAVTAIPGITVYFQPVQDVQIATRTSRAQYQYTLVSTDAGEVAEWTTKLAAELARSPLLSDVNLETMDVGLRTRIDVDRDVAGRLGVTVQAVSDALNDAFGQRQVSTIYAQANQYRVVLEAQPQYRSDPSRLHRLYIPSTNGSQVPLTAIAKITYTTAPLAVSHQDQFPSETISFNLVPGRGAERRGVDHQRGGGQDRHAVVGDGQLLRRRQRVRVLAALAAVADPRRHRHHLHRAGRALRELRAPVHHSDDAALGRHRRAAGAHAHGPRSVAGGADRHRAADGHRQEERHHDDRLRARCRARARSQSARFHRRGGAVALPADHDDDAGCPVRRAAPRHRERRRLGVAQPARHHHRRRAAAEPAPDAVHDAGDLPCHGAAEGAFQRAAGNRHAVRRGQHPRRVAP